MSKIICLRTFITFTIVGIISFGANAQHCNCEDELRWVKSYMERNHPGFNSDIKSPDEPAYKNFTDDLFRRISLDRNGKRCIAYLRKYVSYLKDHHSNISGNSRNVVETNPDSVLAFMNSPVYQSTESLAIDSAGFLTRLSSISPNSPEGIYLTPDSTYIIAVIESKTAERDYAGIILSSKTPLWKKGQVKLELKYQDERVEVFSYLRNHSLSYGELLLENGVLHLPGWRKVLPPSGLSTTTQSNLNNELISFKVLDDQTASISIRSFGGHYSEKLDSAYKKILPELSKYRYLIVDVRNNGGGSDANYRALLPFIYTDTIFYDEVDLFLTPENRKAYEGMRDMLRNDPANYGKDGYKSYEVRLNQMKGKPVPSFIPISAKNGFMKLKPRTGFPEKVAILYNRFSASSAEQFIIDASYSRKVILVGENSGGYIAYGNVMEIKTPCGHTLNWTTTRKNRDRKYEFVGIPPAVRIPAGETDWLEYTRILLKK